MMANQSSKAVKVKIHAKYIEPIPHALPGAARQVAENRYLELEVQPTLNVIAILVAARVSVKAEVLRHG